MLLCIPCTYRSADYRTALIFQIYNKYELRNSNIQDYSTSVTTEQNRSILRSARHTRSANASSSFTSCIHCPIVWHCVQSFVICGLCYTRGQLSLGNTEPVARAGLNQLTYVPVPSGVLLKNIGGYNTPETRRRVGGVLGELVSPSPAD